MKNEMEAALDLLEEKPHHNLSVEERVLLVYEELHQKELVSLQSMKQDQINAVIAYAHMIGARETKGIKVSK